MRAPKSKWLEYTMNENIDLVAEIYFRTLEAPWERFRDVDHRRVPDFPLLEYLQVIPFEHEIWLLQAKNLAEFSRSLSSILQRNCRGRTRHTSDTGNSLTQLAPQPHGERYHWQCGPIHTTLVSWVGDGAEAEAGEERGPYSQIHLVELAHVATGSWLGVQVGSGVTKREGRLRTSGRMM